MQNGQTEPEGVTRTRTWVRGEVKFVHNKKTNKKSRKSNFRFPTRSNILKYTHYTKFNKQFFVFLWSALFLHLQSEFEEVFGIVVADARYDFLKCFKVCRIFALIDPTTDEITHNTAEIFMSRIGHKASGVSQHTDKAS